ncbi:TIGR03618 family F420-dependent PPOX class oxidoreductase [Allostreptomyces psammosilenae]|uniref:PPOX class probable F420-dependent enzyme n=1 Tax=Allostreptomyces psammosilenae TaxID=1892865 RepID=A0A853AC25_9ACTN|nr:TIGR03618 family F420-dependent PPOX class oxidoreductase [Allostreptomyces psammosilenae]NYI07922.1 PPOX class probable F420-dependent enzyme [Allostreptomyces psammosilenae]
MPNAPVSAEVAKMLTKANPAVLTTLRRDGTPVSGTAWYLWLGDRILVNMDEGRKSLEHLRRDPRVAMAIMDTEDWDRHVGIQGRVTTLYPDVGLAGLDRLCMHYLGTEYPEREHERVNGVIEIDRWFPWGFD